MRVFRSADEVKTFRCLEFMEGYLKRIIEPSRTSGHIKGLLHNNEFVKIGSRSYSSALNGQGRISLLLSESNSVLAILRATNYKGSLYEINSAFTDTPKYLQELFIDLLEYGICIVSQNYFSLDTLSIWKDLGNNYKLEVVTRSDGSHRVIDIQVDDAIAYVEDPDNYRNMYQLSLRK